MRVMVVEDDEDLRVAVCAELGAHGAVVTAARSIGEADLALRAAAYDCVVFDRMLPDGDALHFVRAGRQRGWTTPVLFLTALAAVGDRVDGFAHGGDDYLVKPFAMAELAARVRMLCRRAGARPPVLRYADLEVDCARREVRRAGTLISLSRKEFAVLEYLAIRPEQVVTRSELIEHCWDDGTDPMSNVVDKVIKRVRDKLHEPGLVHTIRGRGYRLATA
ncbi:MULTISPECIES: response regulator transcription factor [Actinokineospora]|uniref:DNA-binding response regulator n=1 Tax=Actinokineospora fastidiosa TaxID=1816 RepID=A0A918GU67_9PSEU|nr:MULTISPECIES: response regulator transcription factor [Actinokineospora]UVS79276.1 Transcriptional regulatory protein TcrA [Actinokineospora sp. UTMC 2448]GGS60144.1 DNA-binding response regulator [Actinokineospora fastidiosa]